MRKVVRRSRPSSMGDFTANEKMTQVAHPLDLDEERNISTYISPARSANLFLLRSSCRKTRFAALEDRTLRIAGWASCESHQRRLPVNLEW